MKITQNLEHNLYTIDIMNKTFNLQQMFLFVCNVFLPQVTDLCVILLIKKHLKLQRVKAIKCQYAFFTIFIHFQSLEFLPVAVQLKIRIRPSLSPFTKYPHDHEL